MRGRADADQDDREPRGYPAKRLCEQDDQRQEREDQQRLHPGRVRIERLSLLHRLIDEYGRKLSAVDRKHRYGIESEYQCHTHRVAGLDPELCVQIGRGPEQEEPPDSVGHKLSDGERPGLLVLEAVLETDLLPGSVVGRLLVVKFLVLLDVGQLFLAHVLGSLRLVVEEHPESHPDEAQGSDDDERDLPTEVLRENRDGERGEQRSDRSAGIEYGRGESPVFLREIFSRGLDGGRKVAGFSKGQDASGDKETIHADCGYENRCVTCGLNQFGRRVQSYDIFCHDPA